MGIRDIYRDIMPGNSGMFLNGMVVTELGDQIIKGVDAMVALFLYENDEAQEIPEEIMDLVNWLDNMLGITPSETFQDAEQEEWSE